MAVSAHRSSMFFVAFVCFLDLSFRISAEFQPNLDNVKASCKGARMVDNTQMYCSMASWTAAHIYAAENYTDYSPGKPLSDQQQNLYATNIFKSFTANYGGSVRSECHQAVQRLACVTAFPACTVVGSSASSISYDLPCRLQCEQATARCPFALNCDSYPSTNCMMTLPTGFFIIEPTSGPFEPLPIIYGVSLAIWVVFAITWNYLTFVRYKNACVIFCRVVSGIPIIKGEMKYIFGMEICHYLHLINTL